MGKYSLFIVLPLDNMGLILLFDESWLNINQMCGSVETAPFKGKVRSDAQENVSHSKHAFKMILR
jgi:hypothetical protein